MVEKLQLPFPLLSDPDRDKVITPLGLANPSDPRNLAIPAIVIVGPDGEEAWRWVSRDFADRIPEDDVLAAVADLGLAPASADEVANGTPEPGPHATRLETLSAYFRGAKFAARAMSMRMAEIPEAKEIAKAESIAYGSEMDRYMEALRALRTTSGD